MSSERAMMAKVRGRIRREIAHAVEEEEIGGEINLVPYLDIVVNTVIFLLATTASTLALANINVNPPRYEEPSAASVAAAEPEEEEKKLNLTIAISYSGFIVAGAGGVVGAGEGPAVKCKVALQNGRCPAFTTTRSGPGGEKEQVWVDQYDYAGLTKLMREAKSKFPGERQAILTADRWIPYKVVVSTMDTIRGTSTVKCNGKDGCLFDQVVLSAGVQ